MEKSTLYTIVFFPILLLLIYIMFFYKEKESIEVEKDKLNLQKLNIEEINVNNFTSIDSSEFKKEIESWNSILIDIRTPQEWEKYWIIPNTEKYIIFWSLSFESEILKLDKNKEYLIYCFHWNRSDTVKKYMKNLWFIYVKDLDWGINSWYKSWEKIDKYS